MTADFGLNTEGVVAGDGHIEARPIDPARRGEAPIRPLQRLSLLCDEGSLHVIRSEVASDRMGDKARPGDGVVGAYGRIGGRPVACIAQDATFAGGSVGTQHADTIVRILRRARDARVPVVGFIESGGARMQEGLAALNGYARIFSEHVALSGQVPQISVITAPSAGGGCYSPALTDFVVMTDAARMFLTGPRIVREVTGEDTTAERLGGPQVHERNGVCQFVVDSDVDSIFLVRQLLGYLPQHAGAEPPRAAPEQPDGPDPGDLVPLDGRRPYDVRAVAKSIVDRGSLLEVAPKWAPNLVTAFARLEGRAVGVVANQPRELGGVLDANAGQKGGRFVRTCNAFGLPLIVLVDTPGFMPGREQEAGAVIRHGAKLLHAFAEATVPRMTVVLRKAFGGAYITMNCKDLGADLTLAWPGAELGIMGAHQAVGIIHRRDLAAADDVNRVRERLADDYSARHLTARGAARHGHIDEVIRPGETRGRLAWALDAVSTLRGASGSVRNIPL
jgi:acetyl-CoA carboxylase carboxyltransferase component